MNKRLLTGIGLLAVLAVLGLGASAFPFGDGQPSADQKVFMDSMQKAIQDKDFSAWKTLMESRITQDAFNKLVQENDKRAQVKQLRDDLKQAQASNDTAKVADLKSKLQALMPQSPNKGPQGQRQGMGQGMKIGQGQGMGQGMGMGQKGSHGPMRQMDHQGMGMPMRGMNPQSTSPTAPPQGQ